VTLAVPEQLSRFETVSYAAWAPSSASVNVTPVPAAPPVPTAATTRVSPFAGVPMVMVVPTVMLETLVTLIFVSPAAAGAASAVVKTVQAMFLSTRAVPSRLIRTPVWPVAPRSTSRAVRSRTTRPVLVKSVPVQVEVIRGRHESELRGRADRDCRRSSSPQAG
jgi:hypothetical protein